MLRLSVLLLVLYSCGGEAPTSSSQAVPSAGSQPIRLTTFRYTAADQQLLQRIQTTTNVPIQVAYLPAEDFTTVESISEKGGAADIYWLPNLNAAHLLAEAGALDTASVLGMAAGRVSPRYGDALGYWSAMSYWTPAIVYRRANRRTPPFQTYQQLAVNQSEGPIAIAPPEQSGLVGIVAAMMVDRGTADAERWLRNFAGNVEVVEADDFQLIQEVLDGNRPFAFINSSALTRYKRSGNPEAFERAGELAIVHPADAETGRSYINATIAALSANSGQEGVARRILSRFFSQNTQQELADASFEYPVESFTSSSDFLFEYAVPQFSLLEMEVVKEYIPQAREAVRRAFATN